MAYRRPYDTRRRRTVVLPAYPTYRNAERPNRGLGFITPHQRVALSTALGDPVPLSRAMCEHEDRSVANPRGPE